MLEEQASSDDVAPEERASETDETTMVRRAQMGSAAAFEQLVVSRGPALYRYVYARVRNEQDARDALQETLTAAWISLPALREPARFWPWLVGIARHKSADVARTRAVTPQPAEVAASPDESAVDLRDALGHLSPRFREILLLRHGLELSERETAAVLGIRVGTVKSRTARARRALEELLR